MRTDRPESRWPLIYAVIVHIGLLVMLTVSVNWESEETKPEDAIIEATLLSDEQVQEQIDALQKAEQSEMDRLDAERDKAESEAEDAKRKQIEEEQRLEDLRKETKDEQQRLDDAKAAREREQAKAAREREQAEADREREQAEADRRAAEAQQLAKQIEADSQARAQEQLALARERQQLAASQASQAAEDEKQKRIEDTRRAVAAELKQILLAKAAIVKRKKEALEKQKAVKEAEAGRVAQEKKVRRRKERKAELAKQLAADKAASDAKASEAAAQALKNALRVYTGRILRDVQAAWREPDGMPADLKTVLRVKQAANGKVESVEIDSSSGNSVFDRSAEQAVRRASPLPLPGDERLFKQFIKFTFKPPGA